MTDGLNSVLSNDLAAPTDTNSKNLKLASPQSVTATRLDQLVYSPNWYIQIVILNFSPAVGSNPQPFEVKVQHATDRAIYIFKSNIWIRLEFSFRWMTTSQVTVDHGFQLWDPGSRSPDCDVVSVAYPLDRSS